MSTRQFSIVLYRAKESASVAHFFRDLQSFFKKFPLNYELLIVSEVGTPELESFDSSSEKEKIVHLKNRTFLGRAESLRQGFNLASGQILVPADPTLPTPLGDLFKILQHMIADDLDACWGERVSKKNLGLQSPQGLRLKNDRLFNDILIERKKYLSPDPTCEVMAIKKNSWGNLNEQLPPLKGWHLGIKLKNKVPSSWKQTHVPVQDLGSVDSSYRIWRVRWELLKQCLF